MQTSTEVQTKQNTAITTMPTGTWGKAGVDQSDVLIPRIMLMQPMSSLVGTGNCKPGDIVSSTTGKVIADGKQTVKFIPFFHYKEWIRSEMVNNLPKFVSKEPWTPANSRKEWIEEVNGKTFKNTCCMNFFVYLEEDCAEGKQAIPHLLTFRSTSYKVGKKLATWFQESEANNLRWSRVLWGLKSKFIQDDKGRYYVFELTNTGELSPERGEVAAYHWYKQLSASLSSVKVDRDETDTVSDEDKSDEDVPF